MAGAFGSVGIPDCEHSIPIRRGLRSWFAAIGAAVALTGSMVPCRAQGVDAPVVVIRTLPGNTPKQATKPKAAARSQQPSVKTKSSSPALKEATSAPAPPRRRRRVVRTRPAIEPAPRVAEARPQPRSRHTPADDVSSVRSVQRTKRKRPAAEESDRRVAQDLSQPTGRSARRKRPEAMDDRQSKRPEPPVTQTARRGARSLNAEGYALLRRGRYAEAEEPLRAAVRMKSNYGYALYNLGWSLLAQGKAREAIEPLRDAAALQPNRWEPLQKLSEAYSQIGNHDLAFEARAKARELRGDSDRRSPRTQVKPSRGAQMAVRALLGDAAWVGSTNRREDQYLQERQEFRLRLETAQADQR